jgi:putative ABC transport system substrate-binding protein
VDRRRLSLMLLAGALAVPLAVGAQQGRTSYRLTIAHPSTPVSEMTESASPYYKVFFSELRRLGYVEGQNLVVDRRTAEGRIERFPEFAREVVQGRPDVIFATSSRLIKHLNTATTTIPIVGMTGDPVAAGIVKNLARPGANITGFAATSGDEIYAKHVELLHEAVPEARRVAFLGPRSSWDGRDGVVMREAAQRTGLELVGVPLNSPIQESEFRRAFAVIARERVHAVIVSNDPETFTHRRVIAELANATRLPTIAGVGEFVRMGGLLSYGVDLLHVIRGAAQYIVRILQGAKPGDLPYQQPTKYELFINLKTAKALGLTIPPSLLARADQVIE